MRRRGALFVALCALAACGDNKPVEVLDASPLVEPSLVLPESFTLVEGETVTLPVKLAENIAEPVTIRVASSDVGVATVSPSTFTLSNASEVVDVTIVGLEDDGDIMDELTNVQLTTDGGPTRYVVTHVLDNDVQQIVVSTTTLSVREQSTATFDVRLTRRPSGMTNVSLWSDTPQLAYPSPASMVFGPTDYNVPQTVTVYGELDADTVGGNARIYVGGLPSVPNSYVDLAVIDDDFQQILLSAGAMNLDEGTSAMFTVVLAYDPLTQVNVVAQSTDPTAIGLPGATGLQFHSANYNTPQSVMIEAVEDTDSLHEATTVTVSSGNMTALVNVTVNDNDDILVDRSTMDVLEGRTDTFTVRLANDPGYPGKTVTIDVVNGDATVAPSTITLSSATYMTGLPVTVTGLIDATSTANKSATVRVAAPGQSPRLIAVTVRDAIPGTLNALRFSHENASTGGFGWMQIDFQPENFWPGDGQLIVDLPAGFDASAATFSTSNLDGAFNVSATASRITVTRSGGTSASYPNHVTVRVANVRNPPYGNTPLPITVATRTAAGVLIDTATASDSISPAALAASSVTFANLAPGASGNVTISFTTTNPWPGDGKLRLLFPFPMVFDISAANVVGQTGIDGTFAASASGGTLVLARSAGSAVPAGTAVSVTVGNVANPATAQAINAFQIVTHTASDAWIDMALPKGVTIGCPATMTKEAHSAYNSPFGQKPWLDVFAAADSWGSTEAFINNMESSDYLVVHDFQFAMPAGATIAGIRFDVQRHVIGYQVVDSSVRIVKSAIGLTNRATTMPWSSFQTATYGSATDLWGDTWSNTDIESSGFGLAMAVQALAPGMPSHVEIAHVSATVFLSCP
ncbi:MAG TPA: hypothetical protein VIV11_40785 [Kofleriaceae bacterium]